MNMSSAGAGSSLLTDVANDPGVNKGNFLSNSTTDTPLAEPHGSALAFLSDLHEQVEIQIAATSDRDLAIVLRDLQARLCSAGCVVTLLARRPLP